MTDYETTNTPVAYTQPLQNINAIIDYLNPERSLEAFEHSLRGEVRDEANTTSTRIAWKKIISFQQMNDIGVNDVMAKLRSIVNPSTTLGYYDKFEISRIMETLTMDIGLMFLQNWKRYEIPKDKRFELSMNILYFANACLKRTIGISDKELLPMIFRSVESMQNVIHDRELKEKKFDVFGFMGKR